MARGLNVQLLIIDPQHDFMDYPDSNLAVPGASADMDRAATMLDRIWRRINDTHVTVDSHPLPHIGHPLMWRGVDGNPPPPFTAIRAEDIRAGIWTPVHPHAKPAALQGKTILQYVTDYAQQLEDQGNHLLMIWPPHCLIGTPGHNVHTGLRQALMRWEANAFATIDWVTKGTNPWTDQYGGLYAEVPMPNDPSTMLNTGLLKMLEEADIVGAFGEAESHCLRETLRQVKLNVDPSFISKIHLIRDCTSRIPKVGDGPDFPAITDAWEKEMQAAGMVITTSDEFLA